MTKRKETGQLLITKYGVVNNPNYKPPKKTKKQEKEEERQRVLAAIKRYNEQHAIFNVSNDAIASNSIAEYDASDCWVDENEMYDTVDEYLMEQAEIETLLLEDQEKEEYDKISREAANRRRAIANEDERWWSSFEPGVESALELYIAQNIQHCCSFDTAVLELKCNCEPLCEEKIITLICSSKSAPVKVCQLVKKEQLVLLIPNSLGIYPASCWVLSYGRINHYFLSVCLTYSIFYAFGD
jgi:hypothetical protein